MAADKPIINFAEFLGSPVRVKESLPPAIEPAEDSVDVLSRIPVEQVEVEPSSRVVTVTDPRSPGADRLRFIRMRLKEIKGLAKIKTVVITSALPGDGKSTVALNLAATLAEGGKQKVLVIEADLHQPALASALGITSRPGLAECLEGGLDPVLSICRLEPLGIYMLQAGTIQSNATEALQSPALGDVTKTLLPYFDWVLFDTPPIAPLTDALTLSRQADGVLLVVRADYTPREAVDDAVRQIGANRVMGIIFNGAEGLNQLYSKYSKYYGKK